MATEFKSNNTPARLFLKKLWKWSKRIFLWIFVFQFFYIILLKWVNPPITITQFVSWVSGHGLKRDYVRHRKISPQARLAVIASEDQLFADHHGFDWKSIKKAQAYNKRKPGRIHGEARSASRLPKMFFCGRAEAGSAKDSKSILHS
jgi:monofunctional biosynthetic peptidoglycan transglycosylase